MIGRVAAVDFGRVRIGLAVCDALGISARGLPTLKNPGPLADAAAAVAAVLRPERVERVVIGVPVRADGSEGDTGKEARELGSSELGLAVEARPRGGDTAVTVAVATPSGTHRETRVVFLDGSLGRGRAAIAAAAIVVNRLRA